jgi:uracil-DNA glycosylase
MSSLKRKAAASEDPNKKAKTNASITSFFGAPKVTPAKPGTTSSSAAGAGSEPAAPKFDKAKWVAGLTPEQKKLLQLEIDTLDESWLAHLKDDVTSREFLELKKFLDREAAAGKKVFPPREDVYSW